MPNSNANTIMPSRVPGADTLIEPIPHRGITDLAVEALRRAVLRREFSAGAQVDFPLLARRLGVSQTPLKEAARILADEGLLEIRPRTGTFVRPITVESLTSMVEARIVAETWAVSNFIQRASEEDWSSVTGAIDRAARFRPASRRSALDETVAEWVSLDTAFHRGLVLACHNDVIVRFYDSLGAAMQLARAVIYGGSMLPRIEESRREHAAVLEAIKRSDVVESIRLVQKHIGRSLELSTEGIRANGGSI